MKKILFLFGISILVLNPILSYAQEEVDLVTTRQNKLTREYLRPSISTIFLTDGSYIAYQIKEYFKKNIPLDPQFNYNPIDVNLNGIISDRILFDNSTIAGGFISDLYGGKGKREDLAIKVENVLNNYKIGNAIMKNWFPNFSNGSYSTEVLLERGNYASSENDRLRAGASHRNLDAILYDLGERLINRSYLVVYVIKQTAPHLESAIVRCFVYKLNFDDAVRTTFYEKFFDKSDGIEQAEFPVKYVTTVKESNMKANSLSYYYYKIRTKIGQKMSDFQVKTTVAALSPIRAQIGLKEGLWFGDRFDVMELVLDSEGKEKSVRRGAVRVYKHILDNKQDSIIVEKDIRGRDVKKVVSPSIEQATKFYQYAGVNQIKEGMALVQAPQLGLDVASSFTSNFIGAEFGYRKLSSGISLTLYGGIPLDKNMKPLKPKRNKYAGEEVVKSIGKVGVRLSKEFNFARTFSATVGIGGDMSIVNFYGNLYRVLEDDVKDQFRFHSFDTFIRFGVYVTPSTQIFAQANYYRYSFNNASLYKENLSPIGFGLGTKLTF